MSEAAPFLAAAFDPAAARFAYTYEALGVSRLRVAWLGDAQPAAEYAADRGVRLGALAWVVGAAGAAGGKQKAAQKKRKRAAEPAADLALALGTSVGTVLLYAPAGNAVVATLGAAPAPAIVALAVHNGLLHALHADGALVAWDLAKTPARAAAPVALAVPDLRALASSGSGLLAAAAAPYLFDAAGAAAPAAAPARAFSGFASPVRQLVAADAGFVAIAEDDRQVQAYAYAREAAVASIMAPNSVVHVALADDAAVLAATAEDGAVHIFGEPFAAGAAAAAAPQGKQKRRSLPAAAAAKPLFTITVARPGGEPVAVRWAAFDRDFLVLAWSEGGAGAAFERVQWRRDGVPLAADVAIERARAGAGASDHLVDGRDAAAPAAYRQGQTAVSSGAHLGDLDADSNDEEDEEETLADRLVALEVSEGEDDESDADGSDADDDDDSDGGDDDAAGAAGAAVNGTKPRKARSARAARRKTAKLTLSAPGSFAALLAQALTTGDKQLLEQCLAETDADMIRASIIKLDPALAARLLERLAERMARAQRRAEQLVDWAKWTMVVHGGYLVTVPNLVRALASLHTTLTARIATLPRLRTLEGRLELLSSQIDVRRHILASRKEIEDDAEDVPEFVYDEEVIVNGEEAFDDDDSDGAGELEDADGMDLDGSSDDDAAAGVSDDEDGAAAASDEDDA